MTTQHDEAKGGTPRTDAVALHCVVYRKNGNEAEIGFSFARTLERELIARGNGQRKLNKEHDARLRELTAIQARCAELEHALKEKIIEADTMRQHHINAEREAAEPQAQQNTL